MTFEETKPDAKLTVQRAARQLPVPAPRLGAGLLTGLGAVDPALRQLPAVLVHQASVAPPTDSAQSVQRQRKVESVIASSSTGAASADGAWTATASTRCPPTSG